jgi:uncharacterized protein (UPF0332 family)
MILKESSAILLKAHEKLTTAGLDIENERFNDSVSRSYYAVYHALTSVLHQKGLAFSSHGQTIGAFNKEFIKSGVFPKEYSEMIQTLFEDRQTGDYDVYQEIDKEKAVQDFNNAKSIVTSIETYLIP